MWVRVRENVSAAIVIVQKVVCLVVPIVIVNATGANDMTPTRITLKLTRDGLELVAEYEDPDPIETTGEEIPESSGVFRSPFTVRKCQPARDERRAS